MTALRAGQVATGHPSLWRNRDFMALWAGQIISTLGTAGSATALPLLVLATTGSPADAGLIGAATAVPALVIQLPAGTLIDRWNRLRVMRLLVEQNAMLTFEVTSSCLVLENGSVAMSGPSAQLRDDPQVRKVYLGL